MPARLLSTIPQAASACGDTYGETDCSGGFAYVEVLVSAIVLGVLMMPAMEALQTGLRGADIAADREIIRYHLVNKMEAVLAEPYVSLAAAAEAAGTASVPSSYSEAAGTQNRRLVFLSHYDTSNGALVTSQTGYIWVRLVLEGSQDELVSLGSLQ